VKKDHKAFSDAPASPVVSNASDRSERGGSEPVVASFSEDIAINETFDVSDVSPQDFHQTLKQQADILAAKLLSRPGLPRSHVDHLISDFSNFLGSCFLGILKDKVTSILDELKAEKYVKEDIESMFDALSTAFDHLTNDQKRLRYFTKKGDFIPPLTCSIDDRSEIVKEKGSKRMKMKEVTVELIPLRKVLQRFFELPDAFEATMKYVEILENESGTVSNFIQCEKWKSIKAKFAKPGEIWCPLFVSCDDFQPNNERGPHDGKIGGVYAAVPCLPTECQSKLENIFPAMFFNTEDRKLHGNKKVFKPLIEELLYLQTHGVVINVPNRGPVRVFFAASWFIGDNLGLIGICGFVECFRANFPCRVCKVPKELLATLCVEDPTLLRTLQSYEADLAKNDVSATGIKEEMVFSQIPTIDIFSISCDAMHDGAEGICRYTMGEIVHYFYSKDNLFLDSLNARIATFDHGPDADNIFPYISRENVLSKNLRSTAAEMINFVKLFGFYVHDLIDVSDPHWELYLLLNDIMRILQSKKLPCDLPPFLSVLIKDFNELYISLTKNKLVPKFHFLTHYPTIFKLAGPFANFAATRYEARHKPIKDYCKVTMSRRNLIHSVAIKQQLAFSYRLTINQSILLESSGGSVDDVVLSDVLHFEQFKASLPDSLRRKSETITCYSWFDFKGHKYKVGMCLTVGISELRELKFGEIMYILVWENKPLFLCCDVETIGQNETIRAIQVKVGLRSKWSCVSVADLVDLFPLFVFETANKEKYVVPKFYL